MQAAVHAASLYFAPSRDSLMSLSLYALDDRNHGERTGNGHKDDVFLSLYLCVCAIDRYYYGFLPRKYRMNVLMEIKTTITRVDHVT